MSPSPALKKKLVPEQVKPRIDKRPDHVGGNQVNELGIATPVIPDHQEGSQGNGQHDGGGQGNAQQPVLLFDPDDPAVPFGEDLLFGGCLLPMAASLLFEGAVPPGDQLSGKEGEKIYAENSTHIRPENGFKKGELKLHNCHGKGHGKLYTTE